MPWHWIAPIGSGGIREFGRMILRVIIKLLQPGRKARRRRGRGYRRGRFRRTLHILFPPEPLSRGRGSEQDFRPNEQNQWLRAIMGRGTACLLRRRRTRIHRRAISHRLRIRSGGLEGIPGNCTTRRPARTQRQREERAHIQRPSRPSPVRRKAPMFLVIPMGCLMPQRIKLRPTRRPARLERIKGRSPYVSGPGTAGANANLRPLRQPRLFWPAPFLRLSPQTH